MKPPQYYRQPDWSVYFKDIEIPDGSYFNNNGCLHIPGSLYHFTRYVSPLRNAHSFDDIKSYPWQECPKYQTEHFTEMVKLTHREGRVACVSCTHMYEESWQVRGYEEFLEDMLVHPEWAHFILDRFKKRNKLIAIAAARAGADELHTGDDIANQRTLMFSIQHWREFIKAKWAEVYFATNSIKPDIQIWYHSDGNITEIISELVEIGVTILNALQPECVDLLKIKREWGIV